jgi:AAA family ATP:ADP antiporter
MLKAPSVSTMQWLKIFDNSLDYSLSNTARQALWLPTSRVAKYKAKQAVDSFFMRAGDVLQAGVVFLGEHLAFTVPMFAGLNVVLALAWIAVVAALNPAYRTQLATSPSADGHAELKPTSSETPMRVRPQPAAS